MSSDCREFAAALCRCLFFEIGRFAPLIAANSELISAPALNSGVGARSKEKRKCADTKLDIMRFFVHNLL